MPTATQEKIALLQSSPYHTELQQIEKDYRATHKPLLLQTKKSLIAYRAATRAGNTAALQEHQDNIDENIHKMVDLHKEKKREWDIGIQRLGEDVGGILGRTLMDVVRELGGRRPNIAEGHDMDLGKVLVVVGKRMDSE
ncbi:e7579d22-54c8-4b42-b8bf-b957a16321ad [Sclerotinia trifoliorum]|uniref:E7579d22-54c8-4b42-b8bf-b957a16321ad n=1 Tax=Sclerotinia trifoliorum TaxID=28548 RepID=A0A8H2ZMZ0_9HELO|nr:e7579d22-54c8-4b42-b8bf-b957a16321ad [Sclerotinia trifoliorum]